MKIESIEVYGFGKFDVPFVLKMNSKLKITGRNRSGKTSLLKSVLFYFNELEASKYISFIKKEDAYVKVYYEIDGAIKWVKKKVKSKKAKQVIVDTTFSENICEKDLLEIEKFKVFYFNSEKYYSEKEEEIKVVENDFINYVKDRLLDLTLEIESKLLEVNKEFVEKTDLGIKAKLDIHKMLSVELLCKDDFSSELTTSARKCALIDILLKVIDDKTILLLDDFDAYLDKETFRIMMDKIESLNCNFIVVLNKYVNDDIVIVDYRVIHDENEYLNRYIK